MNDIHKVFGRYIVIDGIDGAGKGFLFETLQKAFPPLSKDEQKFVYTREPGGTPVGEKIREVLLNDYMSPLSEFFLFLAQRKEVRDQVVEPALLRGIHVISDRSDSSTFAYQIRGRQHPALEKSFWKTRKEITPVPSLYIFLDLDPKVAAERLSRRKSDGGEGDRFDTENIEFFTRVRQGFIDFAKEVFAPVIFVDASASKEEVAQEVVTHIRAFVG